MTRDQIDAILERVHSWPRERQEDAARLLLAMEAEDSAVYVLTEDERKDLEQGLREAEEGDFSTEQELDALFARFRE
jgi:predicted transcriptional regulator